MKDDYTNSWEDFFQYEKPFSKKPIKYDIKKSRALVYKKRVLYYFRAEWDLDLSQVFDPFKTQLFQQIENCRKHNFDVRQTCAWMMDWFRKMGYRGEF